VNGASNGRPRVDLRPRRLYVWGLVAVVLALFVAGAVWRVFNPNASEAPVENADQPRFDGYYLCLDRPRMTLAEMYRLVVRKLPHDDEPTALRGCRQAQQR
jgi:hypothetical protein